MVARILRLRLRMLANSFRPRRPGFRPFLAWTLVGAVLAAATVWASYEFATTIHTTYPQLITIAGALVLLASLIVPLFLRQSALDPRQFVMFPASRGSVAAGMGLAAFVTVPSILLLVALVGSLGLWKDSSGAFGIAVAGAALAWIAAVVSARFSRSLSDFFFSSPRVRDARNIIAVILLIALLPIGFWLVTIDWSGEGKGFLDSVADITALTPFGAPLSAPADMVAGDESAAYTKLGLTLAYIVLVVLLWRLLVGSMMTRIARPARAEMVRSGLGWFDRMPSTATGSIGARSLTYWFRDPRYRVPLAILPFVPFAMILPLLVAGVPASIVILLPLPILCLLLAWSVHNDISLDSTAIWLHVSSATRGIDDRRGRLAPVLVLGIPLVVVGSIITVLLYGDVLALGSIIGVSVSLLMVGSGVSSLISVLVPYAATRPGDSPFVQPQSVGSWAVFSQLSSLLAILIFVAPTASLAVVAINGDPIFHVYALGCGLLIGGIVLAIGLFGGGAVFDRRSTQLLAFAQQAD